MIEWMPEWMPGRCHCGAVRFSVRPTKLEALDCNCSICTKKGFLHLIVPPEDFRLETGADHLAEYRFNTKSARHTFCKTCGIHPFYEPRSHPGWVDVNVRALDGGVLARFAITPFDGENWEENVGRIT